MTGSQDQPEEPYPYTGLHAYVFFEHSMTGPGVKEVVNNLREQMSDEGPIVFATEAVGTFRAFAHLRVNYGDLVGLQRFIRDDLAELGVGCDYVLEGPHYVSASGAAMPAKIRHCKVLAFIAVWVEPGRAREVLGRLGDELSKHLGKVFHGASIVFGGFDILVVLDGPDFPTVAQAALAAVQPIDGIIRTETTFADVAGLYGGS